MDKRHEGLGDGGDKEWAEFGLCIRKCGSAGMGVPVRFVASLTASSMSSAWQNRLKISRAMDLGGLNA